MSQSALNKHLDDLKENGTLLVDKDKVKSVPKVTAKVFRISATKVAKTTLKSEIFANAIMLGALTRITRIVGEEAVRQAIVDSVSEETKEKNLEGFRIGLALAK